MRADWRVVQRGGNIHVRGTHHRSERDSQQELSQSELPRRATPLRSGAPGESSLATEQADGAHREEAGRDANRQRNNDVRRQGQMAELISGAETAEAAKEERKSDNLNAVGPVRSTRQNVGHQISYDRGDETQCRSEPKPNRCSAAGHRFQDCRLFGHALLPFAFFLANSGCVLKVRW